MKKNKEELSEYFKDKGTGDISIKISNQASNILKHLDWGNADWDKFYNWFIENKVCIGGGNVLEYLEHHDN